VIPSGKPTLSLCGVKDVTVHVERSATQYTAQHRALLMNCDLKQKENQEWRNAENMTDFLVNRPVVVPLVNQKLPSARKFGQYNC